jgi:Zinc finger, C3HC4 type (RING finger)
MGNTGSAQATSTAYSVSYSKAKVIDSPINLKKDSVRWNQTTNSISFTFDSKDSVKIELLDDHSCSVLLSTVFNPTGLNQKFEFPNSGHTKRNSFLIKLACKGFEQASYVQVLDDGTCEVTRQTLVCGSKPHSNKLFEYYDMFGLEDTGIVDCVVCLTEPRSVAVIPCRHLCLCKACSQFIQKSPAYQQRCPICRTMASKLIQIVD